MRSRKTQIKHKLCLDGQKAKESQAITAESKLNSDVSTQTKSPFLNNEVQQQPMSEKVAQTQKTDIKKDNPFFASPESMSAQPIQKSEKAPEIAQKKEVSEAKDVSRTPETSFFTKKESTPEPVVAAKTEASAKTTIEKPVESIPNIQEQPPKQVVEQKSALEAEVLADLANKKDIVPLQGLQHCWSLL